MLVEKGSYPDRLPENGRSGLISVADVAPMWAEVVGDESVIRCEVALHPEKGFGLIFKRYHGVLCNHALRFVYSKSIAEDIVSEVFTMLWRNQLFLHIKGSYRSYLFQALRNTAYNHLKSEFAKHHRNGDAREIPEEKSDDTPQRILLYNELQRKIADTVRAFPPQCQRVFILSRYEGKKNREIAEELDIKLKTVEAHMNKALGQLKAALENYLK